MSLKRNATASVATAPTATYVDRGPAFIAGRPLVPSGSGQERAGSHLTMIAGHTGSMRGGARRYRQPAPQIVIGVTGHRRLGNRARIEPLVAATVDAIVRLLPARSRPLVQLTVLSPLAEGADRLVVREVLRRPGAQLHVVLPLAPRDYERDFERPASKREFADLLSRTAQVDQLPPRASRTAAYLAVGQFVVDRCDVLIALWNGRPAEGEGGTGEIVDYARSTGCPLFWIRTVEPFDVRHEPGHGIAAHLTPRRRMPMRTRNG